MDRCAVFVDAAWFLSESARALTGRADRCRVDCDYPELVRGLAAEATSATRLPLLRIYWYDTARDGVPGSDHRTIADLDDVKLRLGHLTDDERKGAGALLVLDLTALARERAIASAVIVTGDEDVREGMLAAQTLGMRVSVGTVVPPHGDPIQSSRLVQEADSRLRIDSALLRRCMSAREPQPRPDPDPDAEPQPERQPAAVAVATFDAPTPRHEFRPPDPGDGTTPRQYGFAFGAEYADTLDDEELRALQREAPEMPAHVIAQLFRDAEQVFGPLRGRVEMRRELKMGFWDHVMRRRNN